MSEYIGKKVFGRKGTEHENTAGEVTNFSLCRLEGCGGDRLHVKWPDGKRTYCCVKGCTVLPDGNFRVGTE